MSAFGQAGFGSMNRRNQLRAQGQMDPYGQQVRAARQAPTLNIYQTPSSYQQATGQQQAPSPSQPAQQPAAAQPSAPAMPAYSPSYAAGTAQPIPPQSQGTPPASGASESPAMSATWNADQGSLWLQQAVQTGDDIALLRSGLVDPGTGAWIGRADDPAKSLWDATAFANNYAGNTGWNPMGQGQWSLEPVDRRDGRLLSTLGDPRADVVDWNNMTFRPNPEFVKSPLATAYEMELQGKMPQSQWTTPGAAQPIQPQSQGTPYGADPGYADRVASAAQQWNNTPAGSQQRDWEGNTARNMLATGLSPDMAARVLATNSTRYAGDPAGASQFANQTEQDWIASLSSGPPQAPGPNATADEHSAYLNASNAYGRQQKARQARDERIAAEDAFNDPARSAAGWRPSGEYYNSRGQRFNGIIRNPSSAYRMDASGNLVPYST